MIDITESDEALASLLKKIESTGNNIIAGKMPKFTSLITNPNPEHSDPYDPYGWL